MKASDVLTRGYNPATDYPDIEYNLREAGMLDTDRDTEILLGEHANSVIVAETDATAVGSVYVTKGIMPIVYRLVVREAYRHRGIGSLLLETAEDELREQGHADIGLFVDLDDDELRAFYGLRGYQTGGRYVSMWRHI